jgi:serine phosphatase RsbU (regulator of sigma subunit)
MTLDLTTSAAAEPPLLQCMEIWGGNQAVESGIALAGLDAWVSSRPHEGGAHGGDIHYLSSCATGRINRLLVADVSGHGERVASLARTLRDLMRRYVNRLDQNALVRSLNREFAAVTQAGRFATAIVITYWSPDGTLELCNAGHPRPLWYRAATRAWEPLDAPAPKREAGVVNVPLGVIDLTRYETQRIRLEAGDAVLLYTDSLIEAMNPGGELLGDERLLDLVRALPEAAPAERIAALHESVARWRGGAEPDDDETILLIQPNDRAPRMTMGDRLRTMGIVTRAAIQSLVPGGPPLPLPDLDVANVGGFFVPGLNRRAGKDS